MRPTESSTFGMLSVLYIGLQSDCECFTNLFNVPNAWNNISYTPLHSFLRGMAIPFFYRTLFPVERFTIAANICKLAMRSAD